MSANPAPAVPQGAAAEPTQRAIVDRVNRDFTVQPEAQAATAESYARLNAAYPHAAAEPTREEDRQLVADVADANTDYGYAENGSDDEQRALDRAIAAETALYARLAALRQSLASAEARAESLTEAAENWRALKTLMAVPGVSWSVSHPKGDEPFHVGFGFPMTHEQAVDAVNRGGLGWAPDLETMLRNAAAALSPSPSEPAR